MKTRIHFSVTVVVAGLIAVCGASHFAFAQQAVPSQVRYEAQQMHMVRQGQGNILVLQGDVKLSREDGGPLSLAATPDAFVYTAPGKAATTVRVPMDMATLQVSVTGSGTVFTDGKGDRLTVQTSSPVR